MCHGVPGLSDTLHSLGYIPEAVEVTFTNSEDRSVEPDLIITSHQLHHTVCFEWKSGRNTDADQLQRYSLVVPDDLIAKALVNSSKCTTHDVAIIGQGKHSETLRIGVTKGGYAFPVIITTPTGMETVLNAFTSAPTDAIFRPLTLDWEKLPTGYFPLDADSELWEFAEHAIPHVLEEMAKGATRIRLDDLGKKMFSHHWDRMRPPYKGLLKSKIQQVMDHASRSQFGRHLQIAPAAARARVNTRTWDVIDNPLMGIADRRQKDWKTMLKKHQSLIDYFKNPQRQEVLAMDEGQQVR
jgi:hypothetical protein